MDETLPADLTKQIEEEPDERQRGKQRLDALRRIGQAVDRAAGMSQC
jgi:hypothetical protein